MAYNNSKGPRGFGDIKNEDDVDTQIDFESDSIGFKTNNIARFVIDNSSVSSSVDLEAVGNSFLGGNLNLSGNFTIANKYIDISEMTAPGNPASDFGRLYVADDSGSFMINNFPYGIAEIYAHLNGYNEIFLPFGNKLK